MAQLPIIPLSILGPGPGPGPLPLSSPNPSSSPSRSSVLCSCPKKISSPQTTSTAPPILTPPHSGIITRAQTNSSRPCIRMDGTVPYPSRKCFTTTVQIPETPTNYLTASKLSEWHEAMTQEYNALFKTKLGP